MSNYTTSNTSYIITKYQNDPSRETVRSLATHFGKSEKSIIGKLAREGVYQKQVYKSKIGEKPITKVQLVAELADKLEVQPQSLEGLEKTPKGVLKLLCEHIE